MSIQISVGLQRVREILIDLCIYSFSVAAFAVVALLILRGGSPYPYTDDWGLVPAISGDAPLSISWLWDQHVDHRIPIPKALWFWSLRASGMDFRSGMILNAVGAFVSTTFVLWAIRMYRGHLSIGDLIVPSVLLNPAFNIFYWGFYLQFMSSVVLGLIAMSLGIIYFATLRQGYALAATIAIFCLNGAGMNGTAMAIILASTLIAAMVRDSSRIRRWEMISAIALASATLLVAAYIFATWSPSSASGLGPNDVATIVRNSFGPLLSLSAPRPWVGGLLATDQYLKFGLLFSAAAAFLLLRRAKRNLTSLNIYLVGSFLSGWSVLGAIAFGRADFWSPGIEYHYGYFPVLSMITAWIVLSVGIPTALARMLGLVLLVVFGSMYIKGVTWGIDNSNDRAAQLAEIRQDLANNVDLAIIAKENISIFWWKNDGQSIDLIARNLNLLRNSGALPSW